MKATTLINNLKFKGDKESTDFLRDLVENMLDNMPLADYAYKRNVLYFQYFVIDTYMAFRALVMAEIKLQGSNIKPADRHIHAYFIEAKEMGNGAKPKADSVRVARFIKRNRNHNLINTKSREAVAA
jgi:hypothetical protein